MVIEASERDPDRVCNVNDCNAWKTGESIYCHHHQGLEEGGGTEGNANAVTHGAFRAPEYLLDDIEGTEYEDIFIASFEALCTRHKQMHGSEPDYFDKRRYRRLVIYDIKEDLVDAYLQLRQGSAADHPLVESQVQDIDGRLNVEAANKLLNYMSDFSREIRLGLKHHGLLRDPETKQAEGMESLAVLLSED